ncbi:GT4 family glycosyltransferase PelF [Methanopyrus sp.]
MLGKPEVTIVTEGTYPITLGGVTTWVQRLIEHSSNVRFNVLCLAPSGKAEPVVDIPENVRDVVVRELVPRRVGKRRWVARVFPVHRIRWLLGRRGERAPEGFRVLERAFEYILEGEPLEGEMLERLYEVSENPVRVLEGPTVYTLAQYVEDQLGSDERFSDLYWAVANVCSFVMGAASGARHMPECDVAHPQNCGVCGFLCAVRKVVKGTPYIITEHGVLVRELDTRLEGLGDTVRELYRRCFESMIKTSYQYCDEVLAISDYHREHAVEQGAPEDRVDVIYSGIETWKFPPPSDVEKKFCEADKFHVGTVARVEPIKGIDVFVRMAAKVVEEVGKNRVRFHVVGPIDDREHYERCQEIIERQGLEQVVRFHGSRPPEEILRFYHKFHVFVLSSRSEGLPMALLEAMSAGCPVVASEVGAVPYIVEEEIGRTFPSEDHEAGARVLLELLQDPEALLQMSYTATRKARKFDITRMCDEYARRYVKYAIPGPG